MAKETPGQTDTFRAASASAAPRIGFKGEVSEMVEKDLTWAEATAQHVVNWKFRKALGPSHEGSHVLFSLLLYTHPDLMEDTNYQGDTLSEAYVGVIEFLMIDEFQKRQLNYIDYEDLFVRSVLTSCKCEYIMENRNRILRWLVNHSGEKPINQIGRAHV